MSEYMKVCDTCDVFGQQLDQDTNVTSICDGACRRNPPTVIPTGNGGFTALFPPMNREDFCLQWSPSILTQKEGL